MTDLFHYTSGPPDADIVIVGESWGAEEHRAKRPFVGTSGHELTRMLNEAGIDRERCLLTNVISEQPPANDMSRFFYENSERKGKEEIRGLFPRENIIAGLAQLYALLDAHPRKLIIALGNYTLWALTENCFSISNSNRRKVPSGITKWRGSQLRYKEIPMLPTYHPAAILRKWDWRSVALHDLRRARSQAMDEDDWEHPGYSFLIDPTCSQVLDWIAKEMATLEDQGYHKAPTDYAVDIETRHGLLCCIGLAPSRYSAICVPFWGGGSPQGHYSRDEEVRIIMGLRRLFNHRNFRAIGQNFTYDIQYIVAQLFCRPKVSFDTMLIHHLCWPGTPKGLDYLSSLYCQYHRYWKDEGKTWDTSKDPRQLWTYNCKDCIVTMEVADELKHVVKQLKLDEQCERTMSQFDLVVDMMLKGVKIDLKVRSQMNLKLIDMTNEREAYLRRVVGEHIMPKVKGKSDWFRSPQQLAEFFYERMGVKAIRKRGTGQVTTDDEALTKIIKRSNILAPIAQTIQELRSIAIFSKNYCQARLDPDNRMRCSFNIAGTETFRWSSSENAWGRGANLQTIPAGTEDE